MREVGHEALGVRPREGAVPSPKFFVVDILALKSSFFLSILVVF